MSSEKSLCIRCELIKQNPSETSFLSQMTSVLSCLLYIQLHNLFKLSPAAICSSFMRVKVALRWKTAATSGVVLQKHFSPFLIEFRTFCVGSLEMFESLQPRCYRRNIASLSHNFFPRFM